MGNIFGSEEKALKKVKKTDRYYNVPDARKKTRFEFEEIINTTTAYEATVDKVCRFIEGLILYWRLSSLSLQPPPPLPSLLSSITS